MFGAEYRTARRATAVILSRAVGTRQGARAWGLGLLSPAGRLWTPADMSWNFVWVRTKGEAPGVNREFT